MDLYFKYKVSSKLEKTTHVECVCLSQVVSLQEEVEELDSALQEQQQQAQAKQTKEGAQVRVFVLYSGAETLRLLKSEVSRPKSF